MATVITILSEPVTVAQAELAMRANGLTDAEVGELISAAREAAENYTNMTIAETQTVTDGVTASTGYTTASLPPSLRTAILYHIVANHEMANPDDWLSGFYSLLYPWKVIICD